MFFKSIPKTRYSFPDLNVQNIKCVDIFKRISIDFNENKTRSYDYYDIKPGDTPEIISSKHYNGSPYWYWAILLFNEVVNPFKEFTRSPDVTSYNTANQYNAMGSFYFDDGDIVFPDFTKIRDLRAGDVIIKVNSDGTLPDPYTETTISAQIIYVNAETREMRFVLEHENGLFSDGDAFAIIDKSDNDYEVVYKSKILKRYEKVENGISHFKDPDGVFVKTSAVAPNKIFPSRKPDLVLDFNDTILGEFLDAQSSGSWTSSENQGYVAMSIVDNELENQQIRGKIRIPESRLLQPLLSKFSRVMTRPPTHNEELVKTR